MMTVVVTSLAFLFGVLTGAILALVIMGGK